MEKELQGPGSPPDRPGQGFSAWALLSLGLGHGAVLCSVSRLQDPAPPNRCQRNPLSCDNQKCLQMRPHVTSRAVVPR